MAALPPVPAPAPKPGEMAQRAVLLAAERGWFVHPLAYNSKVPASPRGQKDATREPDEINRLWRQQALSNIGVNTEMSGLLVVDLDVHTEGIDGVATWEQLVEQHGCPRTLKVRTASGGVHLYFRMPDPMIPNSASKVWPGIDVRGNGYVVAPGSRVNGMGYDILDDAPVAELPAWFITAYAPKPRERVQVSGEAAGEQEVLDRVQELADQLRDTPQGTGNDTANRLAFMCGGYVGAGQVSEFHVVSVLLDAISGWQWANPGDFKVMTNTIERAVADGAQHPRPWVAQPESRPFAGGPGGDDHEDDGADADEGPTVGVGTASSWDQVKVQLAAAGFNVAAPEASDFFTDTRQAEAFVRQVLKFKDGSPRYVWTKEMGWIRWGGKVWAPVSDQHVVGRVRVWTGKQMDRAVRQAEKLLIDAAPLAVAAADAAAAKAILQEAQGAGDALVKGWRSRMAAARLNDVQKLSQGAMEVDGNVFDQNPDILNTQSGVVDLRTGVLRDASPYDRCMKITEADYVPGYTHPDWTQALEAVPEDVRPWLQVVFGQATTGYPNREDRALLLNGGGANGKTLVVSAIGGALGGYFTYVSDRALMASGDAAVHPTELMDFYGARLAVLEETQEAQHLDTQRIKKLVGTEKITARKIAKDSMVFRATHTLMINTNHRPQVKESDHGTWRRLLAVPFPFTYKDESEPLEVEGDRHGDTGLKDRMLGNDQRRAVLAWLVEGAVRWHQQGQKMGREPERVRDFTQKWRAENDIIVGLLDAEVVHLVPGAHLQAVDLLAAVNAYLSERGHRPWNAKTLAARVESHELLRGKVYQKRIRAGSAESEGISLHPDAGVQRYGVDSVNYSRKPTAGQYSAYFGVGFSPLVIARPDPNGWSPSALLDVAVDTP